MTIAQQISRDITMAYLKSHFIESWFKKGEDFSPDWEGAIWSGEGSRAIEPNLDDLGMIEVFDMEMWEDTNGVMPRLYKYLQANGYVVEWYDGGTVFILPE